MKERVSYLLGGTPRDLWVGTFHSTGVRILRRKGRAIGIDSGFTIYDTADQESLVKAIMKDLDLGDREMTPKTVRSVISSAKNILQTPAEFEAQAESFRSQRIARVFAKYQKRLRTANALDFDDLIGEPIRLFDEHPDVRDQFAERFRYVLVDEYQDTNAAQVRLIQHLASRHRNLCVVGDDDQSIYGWRGADIGNILSFEEEYPEAKVIRLEQNYRSTGTILAAANEVVKRNRARKEKTLWTDREDGERLQMAILTNEEEEANEVVKVVTNEVNHRGVSLAETAVLYRTNAQSRALETAFRNAAIAYELVGGVAFYQRREIKDLLAYLRLVVNDQDDIAFSRVVNVPRAGHRQHHPGPAGRSCVPGGKEPLPVPGYGRTRGGDLSRSADQAAWFPGPHRGVPGPERGAGGRAAQGLRGTDRVPGASGGRRSGYRLRPGGKRRRARGGGPSFRGAERVR